MTSTSNPASLYRPFSAAYWIGTPIWFGMVPTRISTGQLVSLAPPANRFALVRVSATISSKDNATCFFISFLLIYLLKLPFLEKVGVYYMD
jgi:hypothetical protein